MNSDLNFKEIYPLIKNGNYKDALKLIYNEQKKEINNQYLTDENHAWYIVADLFYKTNEMKLAKESLKKALSISSDERFIYNFANNLFDQKNYKEAINQYKKITKKNKSIYDLALKNIKNSEYKLKLNNK